MQFQVYKYWDCPHENIDNEIDDGSVTVSIESSF
jgi:hypothetical protein